MIEKKKRRGNPDKYRDYMRRYMTEWRARQKIKTGVNHGEKEKSTGSAGS